MKAPLRGWARWAQVALLALIYYCAARLGLLLAFADTNATPVWPPSGIAFAALVLFGLRLWPGVLVGALAANLAAFAANDLAPGVQTVVASTLIALGNTLEAVSGAWLLVRISGRDKPLAQIHNVYKFALIAALMCALAAAIGTIALSSVGLLAPELQGTVLGTWWLGDVAGVLIVTPAILAWSGVRRFRWTGRLLLEAVLTMALLVAILALLFLQRDAPDVAARWTAYLLLPAVGWAAYRHGARGATLACVLIAGAAVAGTTRGLGPLAAGTLNEALISVQTFVALTSLVGMVLCADMSELRQRRAVGRMQSRIAAHWSTLFASLALTVFVWHMISTDTERRARVEFISIVESIEKRISERMQTYEQSLRSARALYAASVAVDRVEWRDFVRGMGIARSFPGIQGIGYASLVTRADKAALVAQVRSEGFPAFDVRPAGERDEYLPIVFIEPFSERNQRAFGFDMMSEPTRLSAIELARYTGEPTLSGKVTLVQENSLKPQPGFLMYVPVYDKTAMQRTPDERHAALLGMVYSPFRMLDLMSGILGGSVSAVRLEVFDGASEQDSALMYVSGTRSAQEQAAYPNPLSASAPVALQAHQWTIRVTSLAAFENAIDRQKSHIVLIAGTVISLLFFALVRTLTAREEYAAALAADMGVALDQSERKFETLVDSAIEFSIIAVDLDGVIRVFSTGAERLLGYRAEEVVGVHTLLLMHVEHEVAARAAELSAELGTQIERAEVFFAAARRGGAESREWTFVHRDGSQIPVNLVISAIRDGLGAIRGFLGVAHNITRQKYLQSSLVAAKDLAEAASRAKSDFVANMSHEIRTPMNAVLGVTHLLGRTELSVDQRNYLDMIRTAGQSLLGILNDVLDFSKIEAGRMELSPTVFQLDDIIDTLASIMTVYGGEKQLELAIAARADVPRTLSGDSLRLQQVLSNLVSNAIKFTDAGQVAVLIDVARRDGDQVQLRFTVRDSGIGMDRQQLARLFSPFTQADASMTRRFGGTGLGLTISRSLAELMGGQIEVDSALGQGSRFCLSLPLTVAPDAAGEAPALPALHGLRVLIVVDDPTSREYLAETVSAWGWECDAVAGGMEALACVATLHEQGRRFDAALVDWQLPGQDGLATMHAMRGVAPGATLPVLVMVSAYGRATLIDDARTAEASAILLKPVTASSLHAALRNTLAPARVAPAPLLAPKGRNARLEGALILLVEDNALNQFVAIGILEQAGARVSVAGNGREALARLAESAAYDVILMDVQMPVMDGLAATRAIRTELGLSIPVIAMSAGVLTTERAGCLEAGMNAFIAKPLEVDEMLEVVARYLPQRQTGRAPVASAAPGEAAAGAESEAGVFNADGLLKLSGDNPAQRAALLALLDKMLRSAPDEMHTARCALDEGRLDDAGRTLHTLRGSIGIVDATRFVQASLALEEAIRERHEAAAIAVLMQQAQGALCATVDAGQAWLAEAA